MRTWKIAPVMLLLLTTLPVVHSAVGPLPGLNISVTNPQRFTYDSSFYFTPAVIQGLDGTAWVFWAYTYFNGKASNPVISYRTSSSPSYVYNSSAWSAPQTLVSTANSLNVAPSVSQFRNGTMVLSFASNRTGNFEIFLKRYSPGVGWSTDQQVTVNTADDKISSVLAASDGSVWLFYDRILGPTSANIYYKVWRAGSWSAETALTVDPSNIENLEPSAFQTNDGAIWMVWSRTDTVSNLGNLYYRTYSSGSWSSPARLTFNSNPDHHPKIIQDSNNTIWIAWNRDLPVTSLLFQNDIFYTYSVNNGASFIPEVNLTNDVGCSTVCPEDLMPAFAQFKDGRVYLFWATNRDPQNYWNIYYATTNPQPFHHIGVTALSASPLKLRDYGIVTVNVTVANLGTFPESFWLFVRATNISSTMVAAQFLSVTAGQSMSLSILWNTSSMRPAKYVLSAMVIPPPGENQIVTGDNTLTGGRVWLVPPGDVDMDGGVDIVDVAIVAAAFGTIPGNPKWNPAADLTGDGKIDILDIAIVAYWFGTYT